MGFFHESTLNVLLFFLKWVPNLKKLQPLHAWMPTSNLLPGIPMRDRFLFMPFFLSFNRLCHTSPMHLTQLPGTAKQMSETGSFPRTEGLFHTIHSHSTGSWQTVFVLVSVPLWTSCVMLRQSPNLSEPPFPHHYKNG